jgi:hypothetical protein
MPTLEFMTIIALYWKQWGHKLHLGFLCFLAKGLVFLVLIFVLIFFVAVVLILFLLFVLLLLFVAVLASRLLPTGMVLGILYYFDQVFTPCDL